MTDMSLVSEPLSEPPDRSSRSWTPVRALLMSALPDRWFVLGASDAARESVVARYGPVEIRRTEPGYSAQTRVKGERDQACATALRRLRNFLAKNYSRGVDGRLCRPLVQSEEAPGRWSVRIGLRGPLGEMISPASRGGRVRIAGVPTETLAVLRLPGRVSGEAVNKGVASVLDRLAGTPWRAAGKPVVRLNDPLASRALLGHFEIAIPVVERG